MWPRLPAAQWKAHGDQQERRSKVGGHGLQRHTRGHSGNYIDGQRLGRHGAGRCGSRDCGGGSQRAPNHRESTRALFQGGDSRLLCGCEDSSNGRSGLPALGFRSHLLPIRHAPNSYIMNTITRRERIQKFSYRNHMSSGYFTLLCRHTPGMEPPRRGGQRYRRSRPNIESLLSVRDPAEGSTVPGRNPNGDPTLQSDFLPTPYCHATRGGYMT